MDSAGARNHTATRHTPNPAVRDGVTLTDAMTLWASARPTPTSRDHKSTQASAATHERNARPLSEAAGMWATPNAAKASQDTTLTLSGDGRSRPNKIGWQAALWATPTSSEHTGAGHTGDGAPNLRTQADMWATPSVADTEGGRKARSGDRSDELLLNGQAARFGPPAPTTAPPGLKSNAPAPRLCPSFVEWLMGWPEGWTELTGCALSETEWSRWWELMQSELSRLASRPEVAPERQISLFDLAHPTPTQEPQP